MAVICQCSCCTNKNKPADPLPVPPSPERVVELMDIIAQGWFSRDNEYKTVDPILAENIAWCLYFEEKKKNPFPGLDIWTTLELLEEIRQRISKGDSYD